MDREAALSEALSLHRSRPGLSVRHIASCVGLPRSTVHHHLQRQHETRHAQRGRTPALGRALEEELVSLPWNLP